MGHFLALALLALDSLFRAWRIQLAAWTAGGRLSFADAFRLNLYGEAASQLTPNRLGGEPARFLGLAEAGLRPVTARGGPCSRWRAWPRARSSYLRWPGECHTGRRSTRCSSAHSH